MKNLNLINWSFGAESSPKQTNDTQSRQNRNGGMPYLLRTLILLITILTLGVGQTLAGITGGSNWGNIKATHHFYFNDSITSWYGDANAVYVGLLVGRNFKYGDSDERGSTSYDMSRIDNTKLYYRAITSDYNNLNEFLFVGDDHDWSDESDKSDWYTADGEDWNNSTPTKRGDDGKKYTDAYCVASGENFTANYVTLCTPSGSANCSSISLSPKNNSAVTSLNNTQTIKFSISNKGATPAVLNSGTTPAKIQMRSYKFVTGTYDGVSAESPSDWAAGSSVYYQEFSAAVTATTTLTVSNINSDYDFQGWYTAANGGTELGTSNELVIYPTSAMTIYARFLYNPKHTIDITYKCADPSATVSTASSQTIGEATAESVTAPTVAGYTFVNWTLGNGVADQGSNLAANPISVKTKSSGTYTMQANYVEDLTSTYYLLGNNTSVFPGPSTWNTDASNMLMKASGSSTGSVGSITIDVKATVASGSESTYQCKVYNSTGNKWWGWDNNSHYWINNSNHTNIVLKEQSNNELYFIPDAMGEYTFTVDWSGTPTLSISWPTSHTVTYGLGGTGGTSIGATYSSTSFSSGTKVQEGKTVIFTQTHTEGYRLVNWYTTSTGTGGSVLSTAETYEHTVTSTNNVYAIIAENLTSIDIAAGSGGSITGSGTGVSLGVTTTRAISATPDGGYYFVRWEVTGNAVVVDANSASTTAKGNGTNGGSGTITAVFAPRFGLVGSLKEEGDPAGGMPEPVWTKSAAADFVVNSYTSDASLDFRCTRTLEPNKEYKFQVIDHKNEDANHGYGSSDYMEPQSKAILNGTTDVWIRTVGYGSYTFQITSINSSVNPEVQYIPPTSYLLTMGRKVYYNDGASSEDASDSNGGTLSAQTNEGSGYSITTGKYFASGSQITFTATPAAGYEVEGWYNDADCAAGHKYTAGGNVTISGDKNTLTLANCTTATTVYVKFAEIMSTVTVDALYGGDIYLDGSGTPLEDDYEIKVGVHTTHTIAATADNAHYFKEWRLSASPKFTITGDADDEDNVNILITGTGVSGYSYLDAYFELLESIYFRNKFNDGVNPEWKFENVYVFFDVNWQNDHKCAITSSNNSSKGLHVQMEAIGSTGIYRAYVPRYFTKMTGDASKRVAFADYDVSGDNVEFNPGSGTFHGSYRTDYSKLHNMFVPNHVKETNDGWNTRYYNKGYWMHYTISAGEESGYEIKQGTGESTYEDEGKFVILNRAFDANPKIQYRLRIDGTSDKNYVIFSEGGLKYKASSTITHNACNDVTIEEGSGDIYFTISPTVEGEYILTIDQSDDVMKLSVNYPIAQYDYVLENTYTGRNKANTDDSTYVTRSNVIKYVDAQDSARYSMFIGVADGTLKLYQCTAISDAGVPTWTERDNAATDGSELAKIWSNVGSNPGVYQFDLTINTSNDKVSEVDSLRLYTGDFYLKTDAAPGGWTAYKSNPMKKNTVNFDRTSATYDNYWCKYFASREMNIKCVIANDYCNQLSDTLKGDDISRMSGTEPYVPTDGTSIRFSYNSATNTIARAYLGASEKEDYLNINPNASGFISTTGGTELYGASASTRKFTDRGDWLYEMDLKVKPGGQAGVQATFTDASSVVHVQNFLPSTNVLMACKDGSDCDGTYTVRVAYDFKTNYMMSAFILTEDAIDEDLKDFDMMWVRHKDEAATQLTIGTGSLTNVRVIGAIRFDYDEMCSSSTSGDKVDLSSWSAVSRPYLKYFISFPFDVDVNSIFGLNQADYGIDYVIQKYDGVTRAKEGLFFGDGDNYWVNMKESETMKATQGYCLILDNDYARNNGAYDMWYNKSAGNSVYIYFPANEAFESITTENTTSTVEAHTCTIDRKWTNKEKNHMSTDSHWNMIGSPLMHNSYIKDTAQADTFNLRSFYYLDMTNDNKWKPKAVAEDRLFKAMSSKFVQWCGTINWTTTVTSEWGVLSAPRRATAEDKKNYFMKLELSYNGSTPDWTYVELYEGADSAFVLREDMCKYTNNGIPQIYTFAGDYDVAYNTVPVASQTIPVGVIIRKNGTYTFSMPTNFSGTVTLIDKFAQTRTNLAMEDYTVDLQKGTIDDRFELEFNISNAPTAIDGVVDSSGTFKDGKAHKFIMNDQMYILNDGVLYDARGARVK